ncbi:hypothetical protein K488DRAFT_58408 [Vararia minispora EC-137]|uniref:Uncharacterized protein n=1 Tax=Vararia minispora EC-137 TaxID=1314806 RepID=A0ACB8Q9U7_9AGAM|nr:hypothetical protein K488DRAFT_58408 [Vararia minispora EC-137]
MALSLKILPSSSCVDMYGSPDQTCTYSISGHVVICLAASSGLLSRQGPSRFQLQSLSLTFEGQSELVTEPTGYAGARLFTVTDELVQQPYELYDEGYDATEWHVTFDLRLPGWLPPTDVFGDCHQSPPGTQYALYASARICSLGSSSSWISLCTPSVFRYKTVEALPCPVVINRYAIPPLADSTWPMTRFSVTPLPKDEQPHRSLSATGIPIDIFKQLEVIVSIPQRVSVDQETLPLSLRFRAPNMPADIATRFTISEFTVMLDQSDRYRRVQCLSLTKHPIPRASLQPPHRSLRHPHPVRALYEMGVCTAAENVILQDTFTLLRDAHKVKFCVDNGMPLLCIARPESWFTMRTSVPFTKNSIERGRWTGSHCIRPTGAGPFLETRHSLQISLACELTGIDGEPTLRERLQFSLPVEFVRTRAAHSSASAYEAAANAIAMPPLVPYDLPVYSHLYHSNGDRKIDHSEQLPQYSPNPDGACALLTDTDDAAVHK